MTRAGKRSILSSGNASLVVGATIVVLMLGVCLVSLLWTPYPFDVMDLSSRFQGPSPAHVLGTDQFGRDILSRVMVASRIAMVASMLACVVGALLGTVLGMVATLSPGVLRMALMRLVDGLMAFPGILLALLLVLVIGRGLLAVVVAISIFTVPTFARLSHTLSAEADGMPYVKAARSYGCSSLHIGLVHVLPNILPRLVTQLSASMGMAMLLEASLSFLGLGVQPPDTSWGLMLNEAMTYVFTYPFVGGAPACALIVTVLGFNLLGDGLNDLMVRRSDDE